MSPLSSSWQQYRVTFSVPSFRIYNLPQAKRRNGVRKQTPLQQKKYKTQHLFPMFIAHEDLHRLVFRHSQLVIQIGGITVTVFRRCQNSRDHLPDKPAHYFVNHACK